LKKGKIMSKSWDYNGYDIVREKGYYAVYDNGFFVCSADTYEEAQEECDKLDSEIAMLESI